MVIAELLFIHKINKLLMFYVYYMNYCKKTIMISKWDQISHLYKEIEIPAKTTLLEEGKVSKNIFIIEKGCLRTWVNNNG